MTVSNNRAKRVDTRKNRPTRPMTAEQRERKRQSDRARKRAVRKHAELTPKPAKPAITSEDFVAAGGVIERLPGLQKSNTYAPRRAFIASPMRIA